VKVLRTSHTWKKVEDVVKAVQKLSEVEGNRRLLYDEEGLVAGCSGL